MVKTISILMIVVEAIVYCCIKYQQYHKQRRIKRYERIKRRDGNCLRYKFRLFQYEVRQWEEDSKSIIYKENVNLICKDPTIAGVLQIGIMGNENN
jgi:hypothetical protein